MNTPAIKAIDAEIKRLSSDDRIKGAPANVFANAPLALIQMGIKGQILGLKFARAAIAKAAEVKP